MLCQLLFLAKSLASSPRELASLSSIRHILTAFANSCIELARNIESPKSSKYGVAEVIIVAPIANAGVTAALEPIM